jgi:NADPH:quinone reductase-like Zn-dependent oxidoreductase
MGALTGKKSGKTLGLVMHKPNPDDLDCLSRFFEEGIIKPIIDSQFPLAKTPEAIRNIGEGNVKGKIIITI